MHAALHIVARAASGRVERPCTAIMIAHAHRRQPEMDVFHAAHVDVAVRLVWVAAPSVAGVQ